MGIPVCYIEQYGNIIGTYEFDGVSFKDNIGNSIIKRNLPVQNITSCIIINADICTLVGRDSRHYIVCFGNNSLYRVTREELNKYKISNAVIKNGRLIVTDKLFELGHRFPDKNIGFSNVLTNIKQSSIGVARKFYGTYNGHKCIVKFSKRKDNKDIKNELKYYKIAKILNIKCCRVYYSKYDNRECCISIFEYSTDNDIWSSFKKLNKPIEKIYNTLSRSDKQEFDKMLILDYLLSQQDRHYSNIALINDKIYPLFDNGECLGIGSIGQFSQNYRKYVQRLPKEYIKQLIDFRKLDEIYKLLNTYEINIVKKNIKELFI